ncbi:MAG: DUF1631 domain-containing protein [Gammaproteobacteria bacterium]|nr:DUF1631 domain-containing protein [Gammaproteobacteria bacterium]
MMNNGQDDNIIRINQFDAARRPALSPQARETLNACKDASARRLGQWLRHMLDNVDDALFEMADKAESNAAQTMYFDAMRAIRIKRDQLENLFNRELINACNELFKPGTKTPAAPMKPEPATDILDESLEGLKLVDDDDLEESLAITNMISKAQGRHQQQLYALQQRFNALTGNTGVTEDDNPLDPAIVCRALRTAAQVLNVDIKIKLIFYKLFDKYVMADIGTVYDEINALLVKAGVLPHLKVTAPKRPAGAPPPAVTEHVVPPRAVAAPGVVPEPGGAAQSEIFQLLQQLMALHKHGGGEAEPSGVSYPTQDVFNALSLLQHSDIALAPSPSDGGSTLAMLKSSLLSEINRLQGYGQLKAFNRADEDTIDVIAMLFDFILDDHSLPDAMKALLSRLQIPMLKVAIMDKGFFSRKSHPARRLLNEMATAAIGWDEDSERGEDSLYGKMQSIVNRVLTEFDEDAGIFSTLLEEFTGFLEQERKYYALVEQRTNQASQGKEKLEVAKRSATKEIAARVANKPLPVAVREFLLGPWKSVLVLTYLRAGTDSPSWTKNLQLVDELLWSVEPKISEEDKRTLVQAIPALLTALREGLGLVSFHPDDMTRLFKALESYHIDCLKGKRPEAAPTPAVPDQDAEEAPTPDYAAASADGAARRDAEPETRDPYVEKIERTVVGTWFELTDADNNRYRAKLSWVSPFTSRFVFVNRKGVKVAEKNLRQLATELREGMVLVLDDVPLLDRALHTVVNNLKKSASA